MHEARAMKTRSVSDKHAFRTMMNIAENVRYIRMKHSLRNEPKNGIYIFVRKFYFLVKKIQYIINAMILNGYFNAFRRVDTNNAL